MHRNTSDGKLLINFLCAKLNNTGNLRSNTFGRMAGNEMLRSSANLNYASSPNLAASQNLHNRNRANWIADNYNYDPDEQKPPTNYYMKRK